MRLVSEKAFTILKALVEFKEVSETTNKCIGKVLKDTKSKKSTDWAALAVKTIFKLALKFVHDKLQQWYIMILVQYHSLFVYITHTFCSDCESILVVLKSLIITPHWSMETSTTVAHPTQSGYGSLEVQKLAIE